MIAVRHYQDTRPPTLPQHVTTPQSTGKSGGGLIFAQNMLGMNAVCDSQALHHCCFSGRIFPYPSSDQEIRGIAPLPQVNGVQDAALEGRARLPAWPYRGPEHYDHIVCDGRSLRMLLEHRFLSHCPVLSRRMRSHGRSVGKRGGHMYILVLL